MLHLVKNEYLMRYDKVCKYLHYSIYKAVDNESTGKWCTRAHTHTHTHTQASA